MGSNPSAHLAYGYDLGSEEDFKAAERGEYGSPKLPWYDTDDEDDEDDDSEPTGDFPELAERVLLESIGFTETDWSADGYFERERAAKARLGVEFTFSGGDVPGWILIASGSEQSVDWAETILLNPAELAMARTDWDAKLAAALATLGITPTQDGPGWIVFPSYG